ncbi:sensor histidine kinase [Actinomadura flavalba]|uniref:sensor histidine kinase n=1 Tax=Actinomadura flavalba TaxID=1120938 RepID=UPI00037187AE|nr:histidine kinase [Actinomadura flavalba]
MASWAEPGEPREVLPEGVVGAFRLLMKLRLLMALMTLLLLPDRLADPLSFALVLGVAALSGILVRGSGAIAPRVARHPLLFGLDMVGSFAVLGIGGTSGPYLLATVATAALAGLLYRWAGMLAVATLQIACYGAVLGLTGGGGDFQSVIGQPMLYLLAGFAGVALRTLLDEQQETQRARRAAEVVTAAALERARLARELHDSLAKTLRGIALAAAALPLWVRNDPDRAVTEAETIAAATEIASREARSLLAELRDDDPGRSLAQVLGAVVDRFERTSGIVVLGRPEPGIELAPDARHELVAILGELLTNVERHARAGSARLCFTSEGDAAVLTVEDDGVGFEPRPLDELAREGHYGMVGLAERAARGGGTVRVRSERGAGTTVEVRFPALRPDAAAVPHGAR